MSCDVQSLLDAAACYTCLSGGRLSAVLVYLTCQWAAK